MTEEVVRATGADGYIGGRGQDIVDGQVDGNDGIATVYCGQGGIVSTGGGEELTKEVVRATGADGDVGGRG